MRCRRCASSCANATRSRADPQPAARGHPARPPRTSGDICSRARSAGMPTDRRNADRRVGPGSGPLQPCHYSNQALRVGCLADRGGDRRSRSEHDCRARMRGGPALGRLGSARDRRRVRAASVRVRLLHPVCSPGRSYRCSRDLADHNRLGHCRPPADGRRATREPLGYVSGGRRWPVGQIFVVGARPARKALRCLKRQLPDVTCRQLVADQAGRVGRCESPTTGRPTPPTSTSPTSRSRSVTPAYPRPATAQPRRVHRAQLARQPPRRHSSPGRQQHPASRPPRPGRDHRLASTTPPAPDREERYGSYRARRE